LVHLRVEPAHFDWRWRGRPALARLAWEALARDPLARLCRIQVESTGTRINFRPASITHRDIGLADRIQARANGGRKIPPVSGPTGLRGHRRSPPLGCPKLLRRPGQLTRGDGVRRSNRSVWSGIRPDMSEGAWQHSSCVIAVIQSAIAKTVPSCTREIDPPEPVHPDEER
jgi:hypothetical protein